MFGMLSCLEVSGCGIAFFTLFFFPGGRVIRYKDAMKETTSIHEGHPQQKLQATRTTSMWANTKACIESACFFFFFFFGGRDIH